MLKVMWESCMKPLSIYMYSSKFVIKCNISLRYDLGFVTHKPKNYTYN